MITNNVNGKIYIGETIDPDRRWATHKSTAKVNKKQYPLYRSMRKHGIDNFTFEIIEVHPTEEEALLAEVFWIAYYKSIGAILYNINGGGSSGRTGMKQTVECKQKCSETKMCELNPMYGKRYTENERLKFSNRRTMTQDQKNKLSIINVNMPIVRERNSKPIIGSRFDGTDVEFDSVADAVEKLGAHNRNAITRVLRGARHSYLGYRFRYKNTPEAPEPSSTTVDP